MGFWNPPRPHRYSRRFVILVAVLYILVYPVAYVILHVARSHFVEVAGTDAGFATDRDALRMLAKIAAVQLGLAACWLAVLGALKLLLAIFKRFE